MEKSEICIIEGCGRIRDKKQNRRICQMHRVRYSRHKSYELPTAPKLPEGILKVCKKHGPLTSVGVYLRLPGKEWLSCRLCTKERNERSRAKADYPAQNARRKYFSLTKGGLKVEKRIYYEMLEAQNNLCAICNEPESIQISKRNENPKRLAIDHCHKTNKIRGLLCHKCNVSIGAMRESIPLLQAAITYLQEHQET